MIIKMQETKTAFKSAIASVFLNVLFAILVAPLFMILTAPFFVIYRILEKLDSTRAEKRRATDIRMKVNALNRYVIATRGILRIVKTYASRQGKIEQYDQAIEVKRIEIAIIKEMIKRGKN